MAMTNVLINQNEFEWHVRGEVDLNASAAVIATRGTGLVAVKTGTGTYTVTVPGTQALKLVEILHREIQFTGGTNPATALGTKITTVTQTATDDSIVITIKTLASPTSGVDTDGTAAVTLSFQVVLRVGKMGNPL